MQDINKSLISAVREGRLEIARELISSYGLSYSPGWSEGYVLLLDAVENQHAAIAKLLLTSGSKVNSKSIEPSNTPLHFAAINGDLEIVELILDKGGNVNAKNQDGRTPLRIAVENKKWEISELLLRYGSDVNTRDNYDASTFCVAVQTGCLQIVEHLLYYGANVNCVDWSTSKWRKSYAPLHLAVKKGSEEVVTLLLSRGANVDVEGEDSITPLHIAAMKGYIRIAEDLLNHGACIHSLTLKEGYTPLHFATKAGHIAFVNLLLQHGAKVDDQDKDGKTILHFAVEKRNVMIVKDVLKYCPDINNEGNRSALKTAVYGCGKEYRNIVEALLEYGFTVNPEDANNPTLLHAAVAKGYLKIVEDLLKHVADVNSLLNSSTDKGFTSLHTVAKNKQEAVAKLLVRYGADVNAQDIYGKTPIFYAIKNVDIKITKLLLTNRVNVKENPELLHFAVKKECIEMVEALLQQDADVNGRDKYDTTPLHAAVQKRGYLKIVELLLKHGADVNARDVYNISPLCDAIQSGCLLESVELLLKHGADLNARDLSIRPLFVAVKRRCLESVKLFLKYGADVNAQDITQNTPLFYAIKNADLKITKLLLTMRANVKENPELLHFAVKKECIEIIEALLQHDADVNASDEDGKTALHFTAFKERDGFSGSLTIENPDNIKTEIAKLLLSKSANVNAQTLNGETTLHLASTNGYAKVVEVLLEYGADINSRDKNGSTALHIAAKQGRHAKVVETLLEYGADINIVDRYNLTPLPCGFFVLPSSMRMGQRKEINDALKHHTVKIKTANLYVCERNLQSVKYRDEMSDYQDECEEEIASMKAEKIKNANISFYDILAKSERSLAIYVRNENIVEALKSDDFKSKFPIYASLIKRNFRKGMDRKELLQQGIDIFRFVFKNFPLLPRDCTEEIFSYLSVEDLKKFNGCL